MAWMKDKKKSFRDKTAHMIMSRIEGDRDRQIQVAYAIISDMERAGWKTNE